MRKLAAALLFAGLTFGAAGSLSATDSSATSLGQSWPNTTDVSRSPNWHVYVFRKNGISYVQINDLNGNVHGAIAMAGGTFLVLPMGVDSQTIRVPGNSSSLVSSAVVRQPIQPAAAAQVVYSDATTTITATPLTSGATLFSAATVSGCDTDPEDCNTKLR